MNSSSVGRTAQRRNTRRRFLLLGGVAAGFLTGCTSEPYRQLSDVPAPSGSEPSAYRLGSGDTIHVTVFGQPDLSGEALVDASGQFAMPLLGPIDVTDRTAREVESLIAERLVASAVLVDPRVGVTVTAFRPFYILGEVRLPGRYAYENGLTVLKAVAIGGGFTFRGDQDNVVVYRGAPGSPPALAALNDGILPGDVVFVQPRII